VIAALKMNCARKRRPLTLRPPSPHCGSAMSWERELNEYVDNLRALLGLNEARYGIMVERQIQAQLLRRMSGTRAALEPGLWSLLVLCLDGHETEVPQLAEALWERAQAAAIERKSLDGTRPARFPTAAAALVVSLTVMRTHGVYPKPKLAA
ncbi:MAG: hypothetical protein AAB426_09485, partial [Myxococcota bacterium]